MKNTTGSIIGIVILLIVIVGGFYLYISAPIRISPTPVGVTFPAGGETLAQGKTYTLTWNDGGAGTTTQIFLVDTDLQSVGASVSISDRVYGIADTGSYQYTIPKTIPDGTYEFEIGTLTSNTFEISSSTSSY